MKSFSRTLGSLVASVVLGFGSVAVNAADSDSILGQLRAARPDLQYGEPVPSKVPGLYEVQIQQGPSILVSEDGRFFIAGDIFEVRGGTVVNVAEEKRSVYRREELAKLDPSDMIIFKPSGETKAVLTVFTDIDCGYCRKLHREIDEMNDLGIEVHYLAYPRAGLGSPSYRKIATAWCSDNRQETLTRMKNGENVPENVCPENPVAAELALGERFGVNGTPALVLEDGTLIPGYRPAKDLAKALGIL